MKISSEKAFTVMELMVTLAIVALMVSQAIPAFEQYRDKQAIRSALHNLHNDLLLARNRAVTEAYPVVACPGDAASGCSGEIAWQHGWIVFADTNADREFQPEEFLLRTGMPARHLAMTASSGRDRVRFLPDGSSPGSNASITICGLGGPESARKLVISNQGRIRRDQAENINDERCPQS